ncbi:polysaccharide export protein (CAP59) [Histoplasma capsulatum var. duboisii H88]|uniref:Polysaccharide export protein (CAP59) n=1 Tax=Ajellomyces capsulatus (strain H88) TaxID=544711 RepID=A0A8A1LP46_AJEC8|nr:polysaccharide export protein (CAP59) [Histoplasma capsulatum var. duboisii H88]
MLVSPRRYRRWWRWLFGPVLFARRGLHGHLSVLFISCVLFFAVVDYLTFSTSSLALSSRSSSSRVSANTALVPGIRSIYVASTHWNNEAILRSHWNAAVVELARKFGKENIYVSVYESGSWDDSKGALRELDMQLGELGVDRTIVLDPTTHENEISKPPAEEGWIDTARGKRELRRIPYLAHMRNKSLEPLEKLVRAGRTFDKIIFLNDVIFSMADIITLLNTRSGSYAATCSLDFAKPGLFYDTFALRDWKGSAAFSQRYPYFSARRSRNALLAGKPIPVQSCWNGIGVFSPSTQFSLNLHEKTSLQTKCIKRGKKKTKGLTPFFSHTHSNLRRCSLPNNPDPAPLPRHPRLARQIPPRRLRMLPHPLRQPPLSLQGCLAESQRARRI